MSPTRLACDQTVQHIGTARAVGAHGIILFSYDSLINPARGDAALARIGRAACGQ